MRYLNNLIQIPPYKMLESEKDTFSSGETDKKPYGTVIDDFRLRTFNRPKDDIEYSIGKMINFMYTILSRYRRKCCKRSFRSSLTHKKHNELKQKTLRIRDRRSSFRAKIKILIEETKV